MAGIFAKVFSAFVTLLNELEVVSRFCLISFAVVLRVLNKLSTSATEPPLPRLLIALLTSAISLVSPVSMPEFDDLNSERSVVYFDLALSISAISFNIPFSELLPDR